MNRKSKSFVLRSLTGKDQKFLFDMLYEAIYTAPGKTAPDRSILESPSIRKYAENWTSMEGDRGYAVCRKDGMPVGAIWIRYFRGESGGYGYIADDIPELSMALYPEYRGKGLGTRLMDHLLKNLTVPALSLSVDPDNPALRLYERFGFKPYGKKETSLILRLDLTPKR